MRSDYQGKNKKWIGVRVAASGVMFAVRNERNFRIQLIIAVIVSLVGFFLGLNRMEWVLLCLTIGFVLTLELVNTAIEQTMNHLSPDIHPIVGRIKDISAGSVLLASIVAFINGCILFLPKLIALIW